MSESEPDGFLRATITIEIVLTRDGDEIVAHKIDSPNDEVIPVGAILGWLDLVHDAVLHPPNEDP